MTESKDVSMEPTVKSLSDDLVCRDDSVYLSIYLSKLIYVVFLTTNQICAVVLSDRLKRLKSSRSNTSRIWKK